MSYCLGSVHMLGREDGLNVETSARSQIVIYLSEQRLFFSLCVALAVLEFAL